MIITRLVIAFILFLAALLSGCATAEPSAQAREPGVQLEDCQLAAPGLPVRLSAQCGALEVYEDRASASGRKISLNLAVIPAVSRSPAPDPLFFLTGGPGQAATESYLQLSFAFDRINQERDIVLVDQRGTGQSNPLTCPNFEEEELESLPAGADLSPYLEDCLELADADPALYTTPIAMDDLDQVRAALGYDRINLYGVSYGSRAALTYLSRYPENVRAVVLDGVIPQDEALGLEVARDAQRALDLIFERCAGQESCRQAYPDLPAQFEALLDGLRQQPVQVSLAHPISGEGTTIEFTAEKMASAVRLLSYAPETAALLPLLIHNAHNSQDFELLASQYLIVSGQLDESISEGMGYSVLCAEDVPFITPQAASQANEGTYLDGLQTDSLFEICETWPRGEIPAGYKDPVRSQAPVLILSGEADPVTPPENGEQVAQTLPNSLHLIAPGQGHNVIFRGCISRIVTSFIESGTTRDLDTACAQDIEPLPFFLNFSGPQP